MTKPVLPRCSIIGCDRAAGAIINETLLCGEHAATALERLLEERRSQETVTKNQGQT